MGIVSTPGLALPWTGVIHRWWVWRRVLFCGSHQAHRGQALGASTRARTVHNRSLVTLPCFHEDQTWRSPDDFAERSIEINGRRELLIEVLESIHVDTLAACCQDELREHCLHHLRVPYSDMGSYSNATLPHAPALASPPLLKVYLGSHRLFMELPTSPISSMLRKASSTSATASMATQRIAIPAMARCERIYRRARVQSTFVPRLSPDIKRWKSTRDPSSPAAMPSRDRFYTDWMCIPNS